MKVLKSLSERITSWCCKHCKILESDLKCKSNHVLGIKDDWYGGSRGVFSCGQQSYDCILVVHFWFHRAVVSTWLICRFHFSKPFSCCFLAYL